jgi:hypothetical protein
MIRVAGLHAVPPKRISFKNTYVMLQTVWTMAANSADPEAAISILQAQERNVGLLVFPQRRRRSYGRVVKIKMSNDAKKPVPPHKVERHHRKKEKRAAQRAAKTVSAPN